MQLVRPLRYPISSYGMPHMGLSGIRFGTENDAPPLTPNQPTGMSWKSVFKKSWQTVMSLMAKTLLRPLYANSFVVQHQRFAIPNLPKPWVGTKVLQLSDLHFYPYLPEDYVQKLLQEVKQLQPDCIVVTGDMINFGTDYLPQALAFFRQLPAPLGKVACLGNHDYYDGQNAQAVKAMMEQAGFRVLVNNAVALEKEGSRLWISGVDDLEKGQPDVNQALAPVAPGEPHIALAHNPDHADELVRHTKAPQLILSGHTHGGQMESPLFSWMRSHLLGLNFKYRQGMYDVAPNSKLYVSAGAGSAMNLFKVELPPLRYQTVPEVTMFELTDTP